MTRAFCVPAVFFIFAAFVLLFIVSISLPYLSAMDITRVHTSGSSTTALSGNDTPTELRVSSLIRCLLTSLMPSLYVVIVWYMVRFSVHSFSEKALIFTRAYCYDLANGNRVCSSTGTVATFCLP